MFNVNSYRTHPLPLRAWLFQPTPDGSTGYMLPWLPQITQVRFTAGGLTTDTEWSITNDETGEVHEVTGTGSATEATMLDNALAALVADPNINALFSITEDGVDDVVLTARHRNKSYTIAVTGGPSATVPVVSTEQAAGGAKLPFGFVALDSDRYLVPLSATTELEDLAGILRYADTGYWRESWEDTAIAVDRGKQYPAVHEGRGWAPYAGSAPSTGSIYLRRALTAGAGTVGELLAAPAGSAQVSTYTPVADVAVYGFSYGYNGDDFSVVFQPTDATTTVALACDGLVAQGILTQPTGVVISDSTTAVTITTAAGTALDYLRPMTSSLDALTASGAASVGTADVDTIDISSIVKVLDTNSTGFADIRIRI
jgi:hypothetical protein